MVVKRGLKGYYIVTSSRKVVGPFKSRLAARREERKREQVLIR